MTPTPRQLDRAAQLERFYLDKHGPNAVDEMVTEISLLQGNPDAVGRIHAYYRDKNGDDARREMALRIAELEKREILV